MRQEGGCISQGSPEKYMIFYGDGWRYIYDNYDIYLSIYLWFIMRNWLTQFWRLRSSMLCSLQSRDQESLLCNSIWVLKLENKGSPWCKLEGRRKWDVPAQTVRQGTGWVPSGEKEAKTVLNLGILRPVKVTLQWIIRHPPLINFTPIDIFFFF